MPVPSVIMITTPRLSLPAPKRISATPAASASFISVTGRPSVSLNSLSASSPIQLLSMLAAVCTTPRITTPGKVTPIGPWTSGNFSTTSMDDLHHVLGLVLLRRHEAEAVGDEIAQLDVDGRALDARPADVDSEPDGHGLALPSSSAIRRNCSTMPAGT